jgi:2-polyprenyl-6-methoxyphenol hydroxylase-like FAD-dependent oxidoreductase
MLDPADDSGGLVNIAPNGLQALHSMNLIGLVHRIGFPTDRLEFQDYHGNFLAGVQAAALTVMRGALSRVLRETAERLGVRIEFGKTLCSIDENEGEITTYFTDGTRVSPEMLVGADGIHSKTRETFFLQAPRASYAGIVQFGGVTQTDLPSTGNVMQMVFGRRAFFGYAVRPSGETCWFSNCAEPEASKELFENRDGEAVLDRLLFLHRSDPAEVMRILRSVTGRIGAYAVYDLPSLPPWHRGSVCLIGDAAHAVGPHVGQGTSLALEDAFVLAKCLRDTSDPVDAVALFGALRRPRVECIFEQSKRLGRHRAPTGWLGGNLPDLILPRFLRKNAKEGASIYAYGLEWDKDLLRSS